MGWGRQSNDTITQDAPELTDLLSKSQLTEFAWQMGLRHLHMPAMAMTNEVILTETLTYHAAMRKFLN